jgi:hypothetical protein
VKAGDRVRVYPHGSPDKATTAKVIMTSSNGRSIALAFGDNPPFAIVKGGGAAIHPEHGLMMLAGRETLDGPWIETFGKGHYEIEEVV